MATAIGKVRAVFTASTNGLTSGVNAASASMKRMQSQVASLESGMASLVAIQGAELFESITSSVDSAVSSLVRMGQAQADVIDSTSKMAARLGMTYGELAGLAYAGKLADVSMETIAGAATKADVAFVKAAGGSKRATAAFSSLGLSVSQLNGMSSAERFDAIAQAISKLPTAAERSAAAVRLFGRAGAQLMPLFSDGAGGIAAARKEAEAFGLVLNNAQGKNVEGMNDSFTRAQEAIAGVVQQVTAYLAPAITNVVDLFSSFIAEAGGANIGQQIGEALLAGGSYLAQVVDFAYANLTSAFKYFAAVGGSWSGVMTFTAKVAAVFQSVFQAIGALFVATVRAAITPLTNAIAMIADLAAMLPGTAGQIAAQVSAGSKGLLEGLDKQAMDLGKAALTNLDFATSNQPMAPSGEAIAGPVYKAFEEGARLAREALKPGDQAESKPVVTQKADVAPVTQALKGIDSRSREGVSEMFRLMRGGRSDVAEQQLAVQERIADGIDRLNEGDGIAEFAF